MPHDQIDPLGTSNATEPTSAARRRFLTQASKYAAVTPLAVTTLMSTTLDAEAMRGSGHGHGTGYKKRFKGKFVKGLKKAKKSSKRRGPRRDS